MDLDKASNVVFTSALDASAKPHNIGLPKVASQPPERLTVDGEVLLREQSVTAEIHRVLKDYPEGLQIFRELLQNADDAHAQKFWLYLYQPQSRGPNKLCNVMDSAPSKQARSTSTPIMGLELPQSEHVQKKDSSSYLNGALAKDRDQPCLLVFNDAEFQEKDFQAIKNLGKSSKENDATSTGKFGLGFTAVYHITDMPSFLTGEYFCIMDPHQKDLRGKQDNHTPFARRWVTRDVPEGHLRDFGPFYDSFYDREKQRFNGTVFRFVLRNSEAAQDSKLKTTPFLPRQMIDLLVDYKEEAGRALPLLKNLLNISVDGNVCVDGQCTPAYVYTVDGSNGGENHEWIGMRENIRDLLQMTKGNKHMQTTKFMDCLSRRVVAVAVELHDKQRMFDSGIAEVVQVWRWYVASELDDGNVLRWALQNRGKVEHSRFVPFVQVSVPAVANNMQKGGLGADGRLFCFLEIPKDHGLQFNVNAFFELSSNRRDITHGDDLKGADGLKRDWNVQQVIGTLVPRALLNLQEHLRSRPQLSPAEQLALERTWPVNLRGFLEVLTREFFRRFVAHTKLETPVGWRPVNDCRFLYHDDAATCDLALDNTPVVRMRRDLVHEINRASDSHLLLTPQNMCEWFKDKRCSISTNPKVVVAQLKYCMSVLDDDPRILHGVQLCPVLSPSNMHTVRDFAVAERGTMPIVAGCCSQTDVGLMQCVAKLLKEPFPLVTQVPLTISQQLVEAGILKTFSAELVANLLIAAFDGQGGLDACAIDALNAATWKWLAVELQHKQDDAEKAIVLAQFDRLSVVLPQLLPLDVIAKYPVNSAHVSFLDSCTMQASTTFNTFNECILSSNFEDSDSFRGASSATPLSTCAPHKCNVLTHISSQLNSARIRHGYCQVPFKDRVRILYCPDQRVAADFAAVLQGCDILVSDGEGFGACQMFERDLFTDFNDTEAVVMVLLNGIRRCVAQDRDFIAPYCPDHHETWQAIADKLSKLQTLAKEWFDGGWKDCALARLPMFHHWKDRGLPTSRRTLMAMRQCRGTCLLQSKSTSCEAALNADPLLLVLQSVPELPVFDEMEDSAGAILLSAAKTRTITPEQLFKNHILKELLPGGEVRLCAIKAVLQKQDGAFDLLRLFSDVDGTCIPFLPHLQSGQPMKPEQCVLLPDPKYQALQQALDCDFDKSWWLDCDDQTQRAIATSLRALGLRDQPTDGELLRLAQAVAGRKDCQLAELFAAYLSAVPETIPEEIQSVRCLLLCSGSGDVELIQGSDAAACVTDIQQKLADCLQLHVKNVVTLPPQVCVGLVQKKLLTSLSVQVVAQQLSSGAETAVVTTEEKDAFMEPLWDWLAECVQAGVEEMTSIEALAQQCAWDIIPVMGSGTLLDYVNWSRRDCLAAGRHAELLANVLRKCGVYVVPGQFRRPLELVGLLDANEDGASALPDALVGGLGKLEPVQLEQLSASAGSPSERRQWIGLRDILVRHKFSRINGTYRDRLRRLPLFRLWQGTGELCAAHGRALLVSCPDLTPNEETDVSERLARLLKSEGLRDQMQLGVLANETDAVREFLENTLDVPCVNLKQLVNDMVVPAIQEKWSGASAEDRTLWNKFTRHSLVVGALDLNCLKCPRILPNRMQPSALVAPSDLVLLDSSMYSELEHHLPKSMLATEWCMDGVISTLRHAHVRSHLNHSELRQLAQVVEMRHCLKTSVQLQRYLVQEWKEKVPEDLLEVSFLPIHEVPQEWRFPWKGWESAFVAPATDHLYGCTSNETLAAIGCVAPILSKSVDVALIQKLRLRTGGNEYPDDLLHLQLAQVQASVREDPEKANGPWMEQIVRTVYRCLRTQPPSVWIARAKMFVKVDVVSKDEEFGSSLEPTVWQLPRDWHDFGVFRNVPTRLGQNVLHRTLQALLAAQEDSEQPADAKQTDTIVRILEKLHWFQKDCGRLPHTDSQGGEHFLLDCEGYLRPADRIVIKDLYRGEKLASDSEAAEYLLEATCGSGRMFLAHEKISNTVANFFGARSLNKLACASVSHFSADEDGLEAVGQSEPLTDRLRNVLRDYSSEVCVRENFQNAEDAGANQFFLVFDRRRLGTDAILAPEMAAWQGPALVFVNDAAFKESDWKGITKLGRGGKCGQEGKIGRFGLGFNACFNYTDTPEIFSGPKALFLDPRVKNLHKAGASSLHPGIMIDLDKKNVLKLWPDHFTWISRVCQACFGNDATFDGKRVPGTLIRLPLRTRAVVQGYSATDDDWISSFVFEEDHWERCVQMEQESGQLNRIFPKAIGIVKFLEISKDGVTVERVSRATRMVASAMHANPNALSAPPCRLIVEAKVHSRRNKVVLPAREYWVLSQGHAGVATLVYADTLEVRSQMRQASERHGAVCSRLPLGSMTTGDRVHITALFWPTQDRRTLVFESDAVGQVRDMVNENLGYVREITDLRLRLLLWLVGRRERPPLDFMELFPVNTLAASDAMQLHVAREFYSKVEEFPGVHCTLHGEPLTVFRLFIREGQAAAHGSPDVDAVWHRLNIPVVRLDANVASEYRVRFQCATVCDETPAAIREHIRKRLGHTGCGFDISAGDAKLALQYCLADDAAADLYGCRLCPLLDEQVIHFPDKGTPASVAGCTTEVELALARAFPKNSKIADVPPPTAAKLCDAKVLRKLDHIIVKQLFDGVAPGDTTAQQRDAFLLWVRELAQDGGNSLGIVAGLDDIEEHALLPVISVGSPEPSYRPFRDRKQTFWEHDMDLAAFDARQSAKLLAACGVFIFPASVAGNAYDWSAFACRVCAKYTADTLCQLLRCDQQSTIDLHDPALRILLGELVKAGADVLRANKTVISRLPMFRRFGQAGANTLQAKKGVISRPRTFFVEAAEEHTFAGVHVSSGVSLFPRAGISDNLKQAIQDAEVDLDLLEELDMGVVQLLKHLDVAELEVESLLQDYVLPRRHTIAHEDRDTTLMRQIVLDGALCDTDVLKDVAFVPTKAGGKRKPDDVLLLKDRKFHPLASKLASCVRDSWARDDLLVVRLRQLGLRSSMSDSEALAVLQEIDDQEDSKGACMLSEYISSDDRVDLAERTLRVLVKICPTASDQDCDDVAAALDRLYRMLPATPFEGEDIAWIRVGKHFVRQRYVFKGRGNDVFQPYLWQLPTGWQDLAAFAKVPENPGVESLQEVVNAIRRKAAGGTPSPGEPVHISGKQECAILCKAVQKLYDALSSTQESDACPPGEYFLLDSQQMLRLAPDVVVNDMHWLKPQQAMNVLKGTACIHEQILPKQAIYFGARVLGPDTACKQREVAVWDGLEAAGQSEPLTTRLKNTVKDYEWRLITREMAQNAEDARATQLMFVYDRRRYGTGSLLTPEMDVWQGDSLNVFNNARFTPDDWKGILKLGQGAKGDKTNMIGRHGLGFSSVYNITDQPTVLSGKEMLFFDPHVRYLAAVGACHGEPGIKLQLHKHNFLEMWPDQFAPYEGLGFEFDKKKREFNGTLVRLPVRNSQAAEDSEIKNFEFKSQDWGLLVDEMRQEGHLELLFLKYVKELVMLEFGIDGQQSNRLRHVRDVQSNKDGSKTVTITSTWHQSGRQVCKERKYLLVAQEAEVMTLVSTSSGGETSPPRSPPEPGRYFCGLPLPTHTQTNVHVNALFWTGSDRKTIFTVGESPEVRKNRKLLDDAAQATLQLALLRANASKRTPYELFFRSEDSTEHGRYVGRKFYELVPGTPEIHFTVFGAPLATWPPIAEHDGADEPAGGLAAATAEGAQSKRLVAVWKSVGAPVVCIRHEVLRAYKQYLPSARVPGVLDGPTVRRWLRAQGAAATIRDRAQATLLMECFTHSPADAKDWEGCHVCHLGDNSVVAWSTQHTPILSRDSEWAFLEPLKAKAVTAVLPRNVVKHMCEGKMGKVLELVDVVGLVAGSSNVKTTQWLSSFWCWVARQFASVTKVVTSQPLQFDDLCLLPVLEPQTGIKPGTTGQKKMICKPVKYRGRTLRCLLEEDRQLNLAEVFSAFGVLVAFPLPQAWALEKFVQNDDWEGCILALMQALPDCNPSCINERLCRKLLTDMLVKAQNSSGKALRTICHEIPMFKYCGQKTLQILSHKENYVIPSDISEGIRQLLQDCPLSDVLCEDKGVAEFLSTKMGVKNLECTEFLKGVVFPAVNAHVLPFAIGEQLMKEVITLRRKAPSVFDNISSHIRTLAFVRTQGRGVVQPSHCIALDHVKVHFPHMVGIFGTVPAEDSPLIPLLQHVGARTSLSPDEVLLAAQSVGKSTDPVVSARFLVAYLARHYVREACAPLAPAHKIKLLNGGDLFSALRRVPWLPVQERPRGWQGPWKGEGQVLVAAENNAVWDGRIMHLVGTVRYIIDLDLCAEISGSMRPIEGTNYGAMLAALLKDEEDRLKLTALLGIMVERDIEDDIIMAGLQSLVNHQQLPIAGQTLTLSESYMCRIYSALKCDNVAATQQALRQLMGDWVWASGLNRFLPLERVTKGLLAVSMHPFVLRLPSSWSRLPVFSTVGDRIDRSTVLDVMEEVVGAFPHALEKAPLMKCWDSCVQELVQRKVVLSLEERSRVYAPDVEDNFIPVARLFVNDRLDIPVSQHSIIAPDFHQVCNHMVDNREKIEVLGIPKLSELCLKKMFKESQYMHLASHFEQQKRVLSDNKTAKLPTCRFIQKWIDHSDAVKATVVSISLDPLFGKRCMNPVQRTDANTSLFLWHDHELSSDGDWESLFKLDPAWFWIFEHSENICICSAGTVCAFALKDGSGFPDSEGRRWPYVSLKLEMDLLVDFWPGQFQRLAEHYDPAEQRIKGTAIWLGICLQPPSHSNVDGKRVAHGDLPDLEKFDGIVSRLTDAEAIPTVSLFLNYVCRIRFEQSRPKDAFLAVIDRDLRLRVAKASETDTALEERTLLVQQTSERPASPQTWTIATEGSTQVAHYKGSAPYKIPGAPVGLLLLPDSPTACVQEVLPGCVIKIGRGLSPDETANAVARCWARVFAGLIVQSPCASMLSDPSIRVHLSGPSHKWFSKAAATAELTQRLKLSGVAALQELPPYVGDLRISSDEAAPRPLRTFGGGLRISSDEAAPRPLRTSVILSPEARDWLYKTASVVEVSQWLQPMLGNALPPVSEERWGCAFKAFCTLAETAPDLFQELFVWQFHQLDGFDLGCCPVFTESRKFVDRSTDQVVWLCSSEDRRIISLAPPSDQVVLTHSPLPNQKLSKWILSQKVFRDRLRLKNPLQIKDVAKSPADINAPQFWKEFGKQKGDTGEDLAPLEGKLDVAIVGDKLGRTTVKFGEYCALSKTHEPELDDALVTIGCWFAAEDVPHSSTSQAGMNHSSGKRFYVGSDPPFVLHFLLRQKAQLSFLVQHSDAIQRLLTHLVQYRLQDCYKCQLGSADLQKLDDILLNKLPMIAVDREMRPLAEATYVENWRKSEDFAKAMSNAGFSVYSILHPTFKCLGQFVAACNRNLCLSPLGVFEKFAPQFSTKNVPNKTVNRLLGLVNDYIIDMKCDVSTFERLAKLRIFEGRGRICDLFNEGQSLVKLIGQLGSRPARTEWEIPEGFFPFMKSPASFKGLLELLDPMHLEQVTKDDAKFHAYEEALFGTLEEMSNDDVDMCREHFKNVAVYPFKKKLVEIGNIYSNKHKAILQKSCLFLETQQRSAQVERLLRKIAPACQVTDHLIQVCHEMGADGVQQMDIKPRLDKLRPAYEFLNQAARDGSAEEVHLRRLQSEKCVIGMEGQLNYPEKFSCGRLVDQPPNQYAIHEGIRAPFRALWIAIGVKQKVMDRELPMAFAPCNFVAMLRQDGVHRDVEIPVVSADGTSATIRVHRLLLVTVIPNCQGRLLLQDLSSAAAGAPESRLGLPPAASRPVEPHVPSWYLQTEMRHPEVAMSILHDYIYTGTIKKHITPAEARATLKAAADVQCDYVQEWMRQFLEGVPVAELQAAAMPHARYPGYWEQRKATEEFVELIPDRNMIHALQATMNASSHHCENHRGILFRIQSVKRVENSYLWSQYEHGRAELLANARKLGRADEIKNEKVPYRIPEHIKNVEDNALEFIGCKEVYLFHGTKPGLIETITKTEGFDQRVANRGLYGTGLYFADEACKSHGYTGPTASSKFMLYCRVLLGKPHMADSQMQDLRRPPNQKDSVIVSAGPIAGHPYTRQVHREFIVYERQRVYPEYIIEYTTASSI